jgi:hypothetical protein
MRFPLPSNPRLAEVVAPEDAQWPVETIDVQSAADERGEALLAQVVETFQNEPFPVDEGPLVRGLVARVETRSWIVGVCADHLVVDGASISILVAELSTLYRRLTQGGPPVLPPVRPRFSELARVQREHFEHGHGRPAVDFWTAEFDRFGPFPPEAAWAGPPAPDPAATGASETFAAPFDLVEEVRSFAAANNTTTYAAVLGVVLVVLRRMWSHANVGVAIAEAGRRLPGSAAVVGPLANASQVRLHVSRDASPLELVPHVRRKVLEAIENGFPLWALLPQYLANREPRGADDQEALAARFRVPWVRFALTESELPTPDLGPATVRPWRASYTRYLRTPLLALDVLPLDGGWSIQAEYVAAGHPPGRVGALVADLVARLERLAKQTRTVG